MEDNKRLVSKFYLKEVLNIQKTLTEINKRQEYLDSFISKCIEVEGCRSCKFGYEDGTCSIVESEGLYED